MALRGCLSPVVIPNGGFFCRRNLLFFASEEKQIPHTGLLFRRAGFGMTFCLGAQRRPTSGIIN